MPRRARFAVAGFPWHIIQRGINKSACFFQQRDYIRYLEILKEQSEQFDCPVHAYVLMTNHVHLLITPRKRESAPMLMKNLGQQYVQHINRAYARSGTLWGGRYKSCLVESDRYLLACYRYIELNPVRAGIVAHAKDYRWSSYTENASGAPTSLVSPHATYLALGTDTVQISSNYKNLFDKGLRQEALSEIRCATNRNRVFGSDRFKDRLSIIVGTGLFAKCGNGNGDSPL